MAVPVLLYAGPFISFSDVPAYTWYTEALSAMTENGYIDTSKTLFRPTEAATRAEFVKLLVEMNGGVLSTPLAIPSFDDVASSAWYYGYMEEAAKEGWMRGVENCYGTHPCFARPTDPVTRAEVAVLLARSFDLHSDGTRQLFTDVPEDAWYADAFIATNYACVFQGDDVTGRVRPMDSMNRAEMVTMLHRMDQHLTYGMTCDTPQEAE